MPGSPWIVDSGDAEGWESPVFTAMHRVPSFCGVPMEFFVADVLGSLFLAMIALVANTTWWVPILLLGALAYGVALIGTTIEPRWGPMLVEYVSYAEGYEP